MDKPQTLLSDSECAELANMMQKKYSPYLHEKSIAIEVDHEGPGVKARVILHNADNSFCYPVEARVLHEEESLSGPDWRRIRITPWRSGNSARPSARLSHSTSPAARKTSARWPSVRL